MRRIISLAVAALSIFSAFAQNIKTIPVLSGEKWWGAATTEGARMPYLPMEQYFDLHMNHSNQCVPLLVSNKGRFLWSDEPFKFRFTDKDIIIDADSEIVIGKEGDNLKSAFLGACKAHFTPSGKTPSELFLSVPQYNTWIELVYNQNQEDIIKYARAIIDNGFPAGVLMIDDNWQKYYGNFDFKPDRFPDPRKMTDELHASGFRVMLWICPYVSPDSPEYRELKSKGYLIKAKNGSAPALFDWWNGMSACYDLSNPDAYAYLRDKLTRLQTEFGIDGFKFDAGDATAYSRGIEIQSFDGKSKGTDQSELWARLGAEFEYNEFRACWKMGGQPLVQRLCDKRYSWESLPSLVSDILALGIIGHPYSCPDMIGGGEFKSFQNVTENNVDQDLIVRSCQVHALMPMMQFSVAPWRILDERHLDIVRHYALLHKEYGEYIVSLARNAALTGEPIVRYMEYCFPGQGFEECKDQFMLGDEILVAPILSRDNTRTVKLPAGIWVDDQGKRHKGGRTIDVTAGIERLPIFTKHK